MIITGWGTFFGGAIVAVCVRIIINTIAKVLIARQISKTCRAALAAWQNGDITKQDYTEMVQALQELGDHLKEIDMKII